jgi:hypothetical protein
VITVHTYKFKKQNMTLSLFNTDEFYIRGKFNLWKRDIFSNIMHQFGKESVGKRS